MFTPAAADLDFGRLCRRSIGLDQFLRAIVDQDPAQDGYPPYDLTRTSEDHWRLTLALAGFRPGDVTVETVSGKLIIKGQRKQEEPAEGEEEIWRGIATRAFERTFALSEHVKVEKAGLQDGLLTVRLVREVPEALRPRTIQVEAAA